nr:hypothetical protein [Tanacetum cinerariifolium]
MTRDSSDRHFFRLEMWKVLWTLLSSSESSSLCATGPIRSKILNGPMYRGLSFPYFPNQLTSVVEFALSFPWFHELFLVPRSGNDAHDDDADIRPIYDEEPMSEGFKEFSSDEQAMTSDHNSSELEIHDHSNEPSSSKLVPNVVPPTCKTATSRQELELLFHHHITMLRYLINQGFKEFSSDEQAMTSDHNSSELEIHDHSNEPSSSKLVPNVVPPTCKTATSRQELELLFHHHITMLRSTCK